MPEVGRFASPDTLVPDPGNPQSFNRYSYSYNDPINYTDPSGHCAGSADGVGNTQEDNLCWAMVYSIQHLWDRTDYWQQRWGSYDDFVSNVGSHAMLGTDFFSGELVRYYQSDQYKAWSEQVIDAQPFAPSPLNTGDYWVVSATTPYLIGGRIIRDDFGTWYVNLHVGSMPGVSVMRGEIFVNDSTKPSDAIPLSEFAIDLQADLATSALAGWAGGGGGGYFIGGAIDVASGSDAHIFVEGGFYSPGLSADIGHTWIIPWPWW